MLLLTIKLEVFFSLVRARKFHGYMYLPIVTRPIQSSVAGRQCLKKPHAWSFCWSNQRTAASATLPDWLRKSPTLCTLRCGLEFYGAWNCTGT